MFLIMSEFIFMVLLLLVAAQSSSMWTSIIIVPSSMALVYSSVSLNLNSGVFMVVFVMVFIGGLLVLLVSVASLSFQEQGCMMSLFLLTGMSLLYIPALEETKFDLTCMSNSVFIINWFLKKSSFSFLLLLFLFVALLVMSILFQTFKGMTRTI